MPDKGVACHWSVNAPPADHAGCLALVNQIAQLHASKNSIGFTFYNWLYCNHGQRIKGRGWERQSGANGTSQANRDYWAACWIGGPGHTPSQGALAVLSALIVEAPGANAARPHSDFYSTACPGPELTAFARAWNGTPASPSPSLDYAALTRYLAQLSEENQMFNGTVTTDGEVFVPGIGNDQHVYCYRVKADGATSHDGLGGGGYCNPQAFAQGNAVCVIVQGGNSKKEPFLNRWDGAKWSGWKSLGGQIKNVVGTV